MPSAGRPAARVLEDNFTRVEKTTNKSNRWLWKCNHQPIEGRDSNLELHLTDSTKCPSAPPEARQQARVVLMKKGKILNTGF